MSDSIGSDLILNDKRFSQVSGFIETNNTQNSTPHNSAISSVAHPNNLL